MTKEEVEKLNQLKNKWKKLIMNFMNREIQCTNCKNWNNPGSEYCHHCPTKLSKEWGCKKHNAIGCNETGECNFCHKEK